MIITNQRQAVNLRIYKSLVLLILIIAIGLIYFADVLPKSTFGFTRNEIAVAVLLAALVFYLADYLRNPNYIYYSDTGDKLVLRYFSTRPFDDRKNAIEFDKVELSKFELNRSLFGFTEKIIIYRKTSRGTAKYPPVSITGLAGTDREKMIGSLQKLIRTNQK